MVRKFFPLDKNYLLEEAQLAQQHQLLQEMVGKVKAAYVRLFNPLGIDDAISARVKAYKSKNVDTLYSFYQTLAAVYRFKFGENQLTFLWDGIDHRDKYRSDWEEAFQNWTDEFCNHELFIRAVLDLTVFHNDTPHAQMAENRMSHFILQRFGLKMHKQRGLMRNKVA